MPRRFWITHASRLTRHPSQTAFAETGPDISRPRGASRPREPANHPLSYSYSYSYSTGASPFAMSAPPQIRT
jgi:hypothetical protein